MLVSVAVTVPLTIKVPSSRAAPAWAPLVITGAWFKVVNTGAMTTTFSVIDTCSFVPLPKSKTKSFDPVLGRLPLAALYCSTIALNSAMRWVSAASKVDQLAWVHWVYFEKSRTSVSDPDPPL